MLEILYFIGIFPIQTLLESILSLFYILTQSYGLSLILLSFSIQIFLFKLLSFFEHKSQAFNALKQSVNNKREEFKRVFKGAELMSYTQILYKQRGFHPLFALFSLGGLALQIPLFIALIILVNEAEFLKGVGFLWINDLSKPDMIMSMSSMGLNTQEFHTFTLFQHPIAFHLLPFMMCMLSLGSVWIYAQDRGQVIQGIGISLLFFVLLYNMPSALVLYWSSNMLFTLLKGLWWRVRESKQRENNEQEGVENQKENREKKEVQYQEGRKHNHQSIDVSQEGLPSTSKPQSQFSKVWRNIFTPHNKLKAGEYKAYKHISILAIVNICFMICVFSPFAVYSSDVSQFDPTQTYQTLGALFGVFILSSLLLIYLTSFFYKSRLLKLGAYGVSVILLIGVVYTFVLDYNAITGESYSQLDNFMFKNPNIISGPYNKFIDLLVGVLSCFILFLLMRYALQTLHKIFLVIFISFSIMSVISLSSIYTQHTILISQNTPQNIESDLQKHLPTFHHDLTAFSKDSQNVLVLLFDGFSGSHLQLIFNQFPNLKNQFQGFTYYPNTMSLDGNTMITAHTILSGFKTSAYNQRNGSIDDFYKSASNGLRQTYKALRDSGFDVQSYGMPHIQPDQTLGKGISIYPTNWIFSSNMDYSLYYEKLHHLSPLLQELRSQNRPIGELASLGLFYFAPYVLRSRIYSVHFTTNNSEGFADYAWIFGTEKLKNIHFLAGVNTTSQLASIVRNLNTEAKGKTFKYIHTLYTHFPWVLDTQTCIPSLDAKSILRDQYKPFFPNPMHYNNEVCAIKEVGILINFLKTNGIYDNTMIILVSDHSYNDLPAHNMPNSESFANSPNPLLLIKDFNDKQALRTDFRLMSNADVYGILCESFSICNDAKDIRKHYPKQREIIHTRNIQWTEEVRRMPKLYFEKIWTIKDNVLDPKAFRDITQEVKNGTFTDEGLEH